ncbi:MAG: PD40 domain-containing protein [Anaerolineales bacterium]|nr:PD40 domain-containing protein [Anaerolineales bacterium]
MGKKDPQSDILDWTIQDELAPGETQPAWPEEPAPAPAPAAPAGPAARRGFSRRSWLALAAVAALVALSPWLYQRWQWQQTENSVAALIAEQSGPTPAPPIGLTPAAGDQPRLLALTQLSPDLYRAEVGRRYLAPDGRTASYGLPRFFRRVNDSWQLLETPPPDFPGEIRITTGSHWKLTYYAADAALIEAQAAPFIETLLEQACQTIVCTDVESVTFDFVNPARAHSRLNNVAALEAGEPWLFALVAAELDAANWQNAVLRVAAPHRAGIPMDAAALELWRRNLGLRAVLSLAWRSAGRQTMEDGLLVALVARLAGHLGLEPPAMFDYALDDQAVLGRYWEVINGAPISEPRTAHRAALTYLNGMLRGQPDSVEAGLWRIVAAMQSIPSPTLYGLQAGLRAAGMSADEFYARWRSILGGPAEAPGIAPARVDLALVCDQGPVLYGPDGLQPLETVRASPNAVWQLEWSPDGERLVLTSYYQTTVVELATGRATWPPAAADPAQASFFGLWLGPATLAYNTFPISILGEGQTDVLAKIQVKLWQIDQPTAADGPTGVVLLPDIVRPAPDGRYLALLSFTTDGPQTPGELSLLPAGGGPLETLASQAFPPAWSPDGRYLAFIHADAAAGGASLHVWEVGTHTFTRLWNSRTTARQLPETVQANYRLAWSPDGQWLAFAGQNYSPATGWLALYSLADDHLHILGTENVPTRNLVFSADSRWLAGVRETQGYSAVALYSVETGQMVRELAGPDASWDQPLWSPRDGRLLVFRNGQPQLLADPMAPPETLDERYCSTGAWRP